MQRTRRSVAAWIAAKLHVQERIDNAHDKRIAESNYARGCRDRDHVWQAKMPSIYGTQPPIIVYMPAELQPHPPLSGKTDVQFLAPPPPQSAIYEPPAPTTDKIKAAERQRLFGTQTVPAVDNHGVLKKYNEQHKTDK